MVWMRGGQERQRRERENDRSQVADERGRTVEEKKLEIGEGKISERNVSESSSSRCKTGLERKSNLSCLVIYLRLFPSTCNTTKKQ